MEATKNKGSGTTSQDLWFKTPYGILISWLSGATAAHVKGRTCSWDRMPECCMQAQLPRIPKWPVQRRNKIPKGKSKVSQKIQSEQKSYSFQSQGWKRQTTWQKWVLEILFGAVKITQSAKWLPNKQQDPSPGHKHHIQAGHEGSSQLHSKAGR